MTKYELAELAGITEGAMDQYVKDKTVPPTWYVRGGGDRRGQNDFAPICLALLRIIGRLGGAAGNNSPLPKLVARQIVPQSEARWHDQGRRDPIVVNIVGVEVRIGVGVIDEARELAAVGV